ncbi:MAG: serine--tRNA ligase [Leptonema sp. (in: bacteria)]
MLDIRKIEKNPDELRDTLKKRQLSDSIVDELLELIKKSKKIQTQIEELRSIRNKQSKEIGILIEKKLFEQAEEEKEKIKKLGDQIQNLEKEHSLINENLENLLLTLPNWLDKEVPYGEDSSKNIIIKQHGVIQEFSFKVKPHYEIGEELGIINFEKGIRLAGSRFYTYFGLGAKLERALINFMLDLHTKRNGYTEVWVPVLIKDFGMVTTGQYPKFKGEYYQLEKDGLSLIPTAEVPLVNLFYDEILKEEDLPIKVTAATSCFRREAGAAGKDTRGLIRVHQFQKVELVQIAHPESSNIIHQEMVRHAEMVLQELNLPYRILLLCSGDTGATSLKTYDIEVWTPGLKRWLEISSISNCGDYQARRGMIRIKTKKGNLYAHTLNGSGVAIGRTLIAILENYQKEDGSIEIPEALKKYLYT